MGKKRNSGNPQNHQTQSFGQMVSKAALAQLAPHIEEMVKGNVDRLGAQLTQQTQNTLEMLYLRVLTLEDLIMEKLNISKDELAGRVADREDQSEGLESAEEAQAGDVLRLEIQTKTKDQAEFQGTSRIKVYNLGAGRSIGPELENGLLGAKSGESRVIEFGQDKQMVAKINVDRVSRRIPVAQPQGDSNVNQSQG